MDRKSSDSIDRTRCLIVLAALTTLMSVVLLSLGRTPWCKCGGLSPWSWEINSSHNSQHLIDPYSFTHVLHGFIFFAALWLARDRMGKCSRLILAAAVEASWEVLENTPLIIERYREATISLDYYGDSVANSVSDLLACLLGYAIASKLRWYYTATLFVTIEVALLMTIRDSLLLNVIMLVYPNDTILEWQSG